MTIERVFFAHPNKDYICDGELRLADFFIFNNLTEDVRDILSEIDELRHEALAMSTYEDPNELPQSLSPRDCPCLNINGPRLHEFSIFDIPRFSQ